MTDLLGYSNTSGKYNMYEALHVCLYQKQISSQGKHKLAGFVSYADQNMYFKEQLILICIFCINKATFLISDILSFVISAMQIEQIKYISIKIFRFG